MFYKHIFYLLIFLLIFVCTVGYGHISSITKRQTAYSQSVKFDVSGDNESVPVGQQEIYRSDDGLFGLKINGSGGQNGSNGANISVDGQVSLGRPDSQDYHALTIHGNSKSEGVNSTAVVNKLEGEIYGNNTNVTIGLSSGGNGTSHSFFDVTASKKSQGIDSGKSHKILRGSAKGSGTEASNSSITFENSVSGVTMDGKLAGSASGKGKNNASAVAEFRLENDLDKILLEGSSRGNGNGTAISHGQFYGEIVNNASRFNSSSFGAISGEGNSNYALSSNLVHDNEEDLTSIQDVNTAEADILSDGTSGIHMNLTGSTYEGGSALINGTSYASLADMNVKNKFHGNDATSNYFGTGTGRVKGQGTEKGIWTIGLNSNYSKTGNGIFNIYGTSLSTNKNSSMLEIVADVNVTDSKNRTKAGSGRSLGISNGDLNKITASAALQLHESDGGSSKIEARGWGNGTSNASTFANLVFYDAADKQINITSQGKAEAYGNQTKTFSMSDATNKKKKQFTVISYQNASARGFGRTGFMLSSSGFLYRKKRSTDSRNADKPAEIL